MLQHALMVGGCHRCQCPQKHYLDTAMSFPVKTTSAVKASVLAEAAGNGIPVVEFHAEGKKTTAGPNAKSYESSRQRAGAHLVFNAFWLVSTFCLLQMYMRDSLHQIDHGVTIHVLRAILRLFWGAY